MKAVRYHGREDIRVEDVPEPSGCDDRQMIVKPKLCGICGTDLHEYAAGPIVTPVCPHHFTGATLPQILGHEFSAEVVETGKAITRFKVGDRVSVQPLVMQLDDYYSRRGLNHLSRNLGVIGLSWAWGGMGEYAVINEYNAARLPDSVSDEEGAIIEPAAVALYGVDRAGVTAGSTVLITGAGPIGALTALACEMMGAVGIFVSEPNANRRAFIERLGVATMVLDPRQADVAEVLRDHTEEGVGVDIAIECAGNEQALNACAKAVRNRGTVAQVGLHVGKATVDPALWALKDITLEATWCFPITSWPRIISLVESGRFPVERIMTKRIKPSEVVENGFKALLDPQGTDIKILIDLG